MKRLARIALLILTFTCCAGGARATGYFGPAVYLDQGGKNVDASPEFYWELEVKRLARAVRGHWGIENGCHWVLDVTYREDESRIREAALRENFAWLNRFTWSLLKQRRDRTSIAMKRRSCGWDENYLLQILTGSTS